jgi:hypothetical protein
MALGLWGVGCCHSHGSPLRFEGRFDFTSTTRDLAPGRLSPKVVMTRDGFDGISCPVAKTII